MLALDHRQGFKKLIGDASKEEVVSAKYEIIEALYNQFSSVLLDPEFGLSAYSKYVQTATIRSPKQYLLSCEKTGYSDEKGERVTELEYSVKQLKDLGATGIKLLLYVNPFVSSFTKQLETARKVLDDCKIYELPLFIEFVTYSLEESSSKSQLILDSVQKFVSEEVIPAVFKIEFPENESSCAKITHLLGKTPWILLTRGASFDQFKNELKIACQNGAKGFLAGRSVWQEALRLKGQERKQYLETVSKKRFEEIAEIALQS